MATVPPAENAAPPGTNAPVVSFRNISLSFEDEPLFDNISLDVAPGETRILLGQSGAGKSVLLKMADGLIKPDRGTVTVFGEEVSSECEDKLNKLRQRIGMVFQEGALFDSINVRDNVAYRLLEEHVAEAEIEQRVREALRFVELEQTIDRFPAELSGGMRRRVAIARAIVARPDLLLYDSPTGGLDPVTSTTIIELIVKQRDVYRTSSLLVTHRLQDAFTMATHRYDVGQQRMVLLPEGTTDPQTTFLVLNQGKIVFDGRIEDLLSSSDPFLREFIS
jgi:phospholipid/cholesterol/gamma-HCH transport system ATP-binding protein